jgi:predicted nucleic acid-binding protein
VTAIDNDIFSLFLNGNRDILARLLSYPRGEISLPVIVVEEVMRGRLHQIRKAQALNEEKLVQAYDFLATTVIAIQQYRMLAYTLQAEVLVQDWRSQGIRVGMRDMRIAAICVSQNIRLISNNLSDFHRIPNLNLETWN